MSIDTITTLCVLGATILAGIIAIIIAIVRGELKKFIIEKMEEAGEIYKDVPKPERSIKKLQYVVDAVKEKYKLAQLVLNIKKFVEYIVSLNNKDM